MPKVLTHEEARKLVRRLTNHGHKPQGVAGVLNANGFRHPADREWTARSVSDFLKAKQRGTKVRVKV